MIKNCSNNKGSALIVILVTIISLVLVSIGSLTYYYINVKGEISKLAEQQSNDFQKTVHIYEEIIDINKGNTSKTQGTTVLGAQTVQKEGAVLGLEDTKFIKDARKEKALLTEAGDILNTIEERNLKVENIAKRIRVNNLPTTDTKNYLIKTKPVLKYLREMQQLMIEFTSTGAELGALINDAIARNADDISVKNYSEGLEAFNVLKDNAKAIDTSGLDKDMAEEHKHFVESFGQELDIFYEVESALKEKDVQKLLLALRSMTLSGVSDTETGKTGYVSFWEDSDTLIQAKNLIKKWNEVAIELK